MKLPFVAFQSLEWKLEINQFQPKIHWTIYNKSSPSDSSREDWVPIETKKQIETFNEVISCLLEEIYPQEKPERFVPSY